MNWSDAVEILKSFRNQRVLVMGDVMLDQYLWGTLIRVSPEASRPHRCHASTGCSPGDAANVTATDAALANLSLILSPRPAVLARRF